MLRKQVFIATGAALLFLALPATAWAEVLTFQMEGTIQQVVDPLDLLDFAQVGGPVLYSFSFETDAPNTYPEPTVGIYSGRASSLFVGTRTFPMEAPTITVALDTFFEVQSWGYVDGMRTSIYFRLSDPAGNATSISLPQEPFSIANFVTRDFSCGIQGPPSPNNPTSTLLSFWGVMSHNSCK